MNHIKEQFSLLVIKIKILLARYNKQPYKFNHYPLIFLILNINPGYHYNYLLST